jgi:hypothetical protein
MKNIEDNLLLSGFYINKLAGILSREIDFLSAGLLSTPRGIFF